MEPNNYDQERKALMGWLMPSLIHELNNRLTAVRGSIQLSREEFNNPNELAIYFDLCHQETNRIINLLTCLRTLYQSFDSEPSIPINHMVQQITSLAAREIHRNGIGINFIDNLDNPIPSPAGLGLVLVYILMNLAEFLKSIHVSMLDIEISAHQNVTINFSFRTFPDSMPEFINNQDFIHSTLPTAFINYYVNDNIAFLSLAFASIQEGE